MHPSSPSEQLETAPSQPRRLRFSLRAMIAATALVLLSLSHLKTSLELRDVRGQLETLRSEVGLLTIDDPRRVHAAAIPSYEGMTYRWRVYRPAGRKLRLRVAIGNIPSEGLPENPAQLRSYRVGAGAEEFILNFSVNRDHRGEWRFTWDDGSSNTSELLPPSDAQWLDQPTGFGWNQAGEGRTESAAPGEPLVLLRLRKSKQVPGGSTVEMNPCEGFLVWIVQEE